MQADQKLRPPVRCGAELRWPATHRTCGMLADLFRLVAVASLFAAIAWMDRNDIALFAVVFLALLIPRAVLIPKPFDAAFCLTVLFATWSQAAGWFHSIHWLDDAVHFAANGAVAVTIYLVLARLNLIRGGGMGVRRSRAAPVILTFLIGLALGVVWEFIERLDTILNPDNVYGYADTMGDMAGGGTGSLVAGFALLWLLSAEREGGEAEVEAETESADDAIAKPDSNPVVLPATDREVEQPVTAPAATTRYLADVIPDVRSGAFQKT